ncbi:MAG: hypothetical protein Q9212_004380 [Teloschistes hypoglaucus]
MTLDDFEKSLVEESRAREAEEDKKRRKHSHHHHRHHDHHRTHDKDLEHRHSKYRKRHAEDRSPFQQTQDSQRKKLDQEEDEWVEKAVTPSNTEAPVEAVDTQNGERQLQRDAWMEEPGTLDIHYAQRGGTRPTEPIRAFSATAGTECKLHTNELNKQYFQGLTDGKDMPDDAAPKSIQNAVDYTFGDSGSRWRMTKLKAMYRRAEETGAAIEDLAIEQYGDLRAFDDAREEEVELDRRTLYGDGYVGKEKPSGELFQERKVNMGVPDQEEISISVADEGLSRSGTVDVEAAPEPPALMDQTALNRLKAQMMKAKLKGSPEAEILELKYNAAIQVHENSSRSQNIVLGAMDNRMLTGGRQGEVKAVENKRGRERGLVEENEDMSIEDMVREERRTRNQLGGDGQRFAERIAKDAKFDNDLDYLDENATKLAKRVQKSEINLKNMAVADFQKMNRILDSCQLCHHEDSNTPPIAPIVSLGTRVFLTLPTEPEISDGGACIVPIQHRGNLLECDEDEWEEIRNFMKSLTRMYHDQGRDVIFYENAAGSQRKKHAGMEVVPLPYSLGETAPAFFREAILTADEEWAQHKKLIDTLAKAKQGLGKLAFRKTLVKEMPYFHVWFEIDGGLGHVVEDANRWPRGDLFAREIIGGMLDKEPNVIKKQGRWHRGDDHRMEAFRKRWKKFDWTRVLTDS